MPGLLKAMQPVLAYAAAHLDDDVSLAALAAQARLSPFHLQRVFSAAVGETPKQLTLRLRLGQAAVMLLVTEDSVLDIALACGFQSHEVFSRAFRRRFGMAPSAYRDRGFVNGADRAQARDHAAFTTRVGPCVGLYHTGEDRTPNMTYTVEKKTLAPQPVLLVRRRIERSAIAATIGEVLPHIFLYAQKHGLALTGHPFTRYSDVGPGLMTIEPGMRIAAPHQDPNRIDPAWTNATGEGDVIVNTLPGGPAAVTMHLGPYDKLTDAYAALQKWIETEGLVPSGAPWESYITDPAESPNPADWKTEVAWPLAS